jgi:tetratricopeptide (TPR) repeat protein
VADNDDKKEAETPATDKPGFDPKPMRLGDESIVDRLMPHIKKILWGIAGIVAVLTVYYTYRHFQERGLQKETAKVAAVLDVASRQVRPAGVEPSADDKEPTYADPQARAAAVLDELNRQSAEVDPVLRGSLLVRAGKLDEAIAAYRSAQGRKGVDGVLAREGLGLALETKARGEADAAARQRGLEEALAAFRAMQPDETGPRRAYALYHEGRMLALLGKPAEARAAFEKVKELADGGELPGLIDERLALLGAP